MALGRAGAAAPLAEAGELYAGMGDAAGRAETMELLARADT